MTNPIDCATTNIIGYPMLVVLTNELVSLAQSHWLLDNQYNWLIRHWLF